MIKYFRRKPTQFQAFRLKHPITLHRPEGDTRAENGAWFVITERDQYIVGKDSMVDLADEVLPVEVDDAS